MEEACYRRNVDKEGLSKKVVDQRTVKGGPLVCSTEAGDAIQSQTQQMFLEQNNLHVRNLCNSFLCLELEGINHFSCPKTHWIMFCIGFQLNPTVI